MFPDYNLVWCSLCSLGLGAFVVGLLISGGGSRGECSMVMVMVG